MIKFFIVISILFAIGLFGVFWWYMDTVKNEKLLQDLKRKLKIDDKK